MSAASQSINTILSETVERLNKRSTPDEIEAAVREAAAAFDGTDDIKRKNAEKAVAATLRDRRIDGAAEIAKVAFAKPKAPDGESEGKAETLPLLMKIAENEATYWHSPGCEPFATVRIDGHEENWPVESERFSRWLNHRFYATTGEPPTKWLIEQVIGALKAKADFAGEHHPVFVRTAVGDDVTVYIDMGDPAWRAIRVTRDGWDIVDKAPVKFRRSPFTMPLPVPTREGTIDLLRPFLNVASEGQFKLTVGFLVGTYRPRGPYSHIALDGVQGSAKSTTTRVIRELTDPNVAPVRSIPKSEDDLMIGAKNAHVLAFDNLSRIGNDMSDALCRLATGGGIGKRKLYTDADEAVLDAMCPVVLNGIGDLAQNHDLRNRTIIETLPDIPASKRRTEDSFWQAFNEAKPDILGALLDGVSRALRDYEEADAALRSKPRMSDFAVWVTAAETAFGWTRGTFLRLYEANLDDAIRLSLEGNPLVLALDQLLERSKGSWRGKATQLLEALREMPAWTLYGGRAPKAANALTADLLRLTPPLRKVGVRVTDAFTSDKRHERIYTVEHASDEVGGSSGDSLPT